MLHIAVVDDEQMHRDILLKYVREWKEQRQQEAEVKAFSGTEAFYFDWCGNQRWDVLFLDIMMKDRAEGVRLARMLRENGSRTFQGKGINIIFTTGISDYMQEGFEVEAMHYLLKPLDREKVWECLDKCLQRREVEQKVVLLPAEEGLVKVNAEEILYAEAVGHYCILTCTGEVLQIKTGIRELEQQLNGGCEGEGDFVFTHRSYLVNLGKISKMGKQDITMDNGSLVPVSRRMHQAVNERFIRKFIKMELSNEERKQEITQTD